MAPMHSADDAFDRARVVRRIFMLLGEKLVLITPSALLLVGAPRVVAMLCGDNQRSRSDFRLGVTGTVLGLV
ncbi:MAG: hypothetical protein KKC14_03915 [Alphaproteobacteria bacterium]|nr:hypothetical protein [Alphaproteobacteria bacterium]